MVPQTVICTNQTHRAYCEKFNTLRPTAVVQTVFIVNKSIVIKTNVVGFLYLTFFPIMSQK